MGTHINSKKMRLIATVTALLLWLIPSAAQSTYFIGTGSVDILDTYLSQEKFRGDVLTLLSMRENRKTITVSGQDDASTVTMPAKWSTVVQSQLQLFTAKDRDDNESMLGGTYNLMVGRYRSWTLFADRLRLQAGGVANLGVGGLYNTRNSNNPAQARLSLLVMPSAIATYDFRLLGPNFTEKFGKSRLRYEVDVPLAGIAFSPNYGQSYYEIFAQGNYDHNAVPTTFVSQPTFRQMLTLTQRIAPRLTLSIGYLGDYQQLRENNLKQHVLSHSVLLGFSKTL